MYLDLYWDHRGLLQIPTSTIESPPMPPNYLHDCDHGFFQDELSAPPVEDFLPSGYSTTTTETPTAPPLPSPVDAVPAGFDQRDASEEVDEAVTSASQVEKAAADFHNFEDVDQAGKVENVRQIQPLLAHEDAKVAEDEKVGSDDGHVEIHQQVVEDVTEEPHDEAEPQDEGLIL